MKWAEIASPIGNMLLWGTLNERGISFVISCDLEETPQVYRCSYKDTTERMLPFIKLAHRIGGDFESLHDAQEACEAKSKELSQ